MEVDISITKDPQTFLHRVYKEAVSPLAKPLDTGLSFAASNIADFEQQIEVYSKEKDDYIAKLSASDEQPEATEEESKAVAQKIKDHIEQLDGKITELRSQLAEAQTEYARKSATEKPEQQGSKVTAHIKALYAKMTAAGKELSPLSFYLLLVVVDYCIAFSFFKDFAEGMGTPAEQIIGYVLPMVVTLMSMILMQMVFDRVRKVRTSQGAGTFGMTSAIIPGFFLAVLFIAMLFVRVTQDSDNIILEALIWLMFVGLVFVVGYKMDKEGKDAKLLIWLPLNILINLLGILVAIIAWPFENISILMSREKYTSPQMEMRSVIENLKMRIGELSAEKQQKETHISDLPKMIAQGKISKIEFDRKQRAALIEPEIRKRDSLINRARINLNKHKESQKEFNDRIIKLRMGSDSGSMGQLHKELRKIKKANRRNLARTTAE